MRKLTEIKQELSDGEENGDDFVKSITSLIHFNSQIVIKQEESSSNQAEDSAHFKKITSITCQVPKTEPQSEEEEEDGCGLQTTAGDYPASYVIKREIIEVHTEDQLKMDNEENQKAAEDKDSGTEANRVTKSEKDTWFPNFPDNNIDITREMNKQQIYGRIVDETEMSLTQAETFCQTKENHKCSVCAKAFHSSQACLRHMWNTHTGENPYTCEVCGKSFKHLRNLQMHRAVHSDERPFSCDLCDKAFKHKKHLQQHKVSCHSDERPYTCDLCDKAFKHKKHLQRHKVSCHSDERRHSCDMCDKAYKYKIDLQRHKMSCHSDERPYSCDLCDKDFKLKILLDRHKRTLHSDEK